MVIKKRINPPLFIILGFAVIILIGTVLLALPVSSSSGNSLGLLDSLFTATSAVCVTGLVVFDTGTKYSSFGEIIIMILIQLGGLGFMIFGVTTAVLLGKKIGLKQRLLIQESTHAISTAGLVKLSLNILIITLVFETVATIILTVRWYGEMGLFKAVYYALFHSVSAFNNAGFSLWPDSLTRYVGDPVVNLVISALFITGGIGFIVIMDLYVKRQWQKLSLNSKIVLVTSGLLSVAGFVVVFILESFNSQTFGELNFSQRLWAAYFQGVVPRTAGFNTIEIGQMIAASQLFIIFLMFIGASSGSTGGGIKTNTFAILILSLFAITRGRNEISVFHRTVTVEIILRSLAVIIASMGVIITASFLLTITEHSTQRDFLEILFEATSAFGTVGLSMGLTGDLSPLGKLIIIITMFIGRLGPLTMAFALAQKGIKPKIRYTEEKILIG
ncbi:TrkH family potassium uptake protein [Desulfoscipio gibsoniae]|uniref:Potassium uptake protein, TrkH family n=1 Tax=Desulfoscipio gibsoniae DSM 7213 TaxID=767817 RepID=R4KL63_9FIRM|nr:TrkH family potassium uptake protein [Desulfoscipio gibsoniae]AGL03399.1 potassium uptake protein, TrkH family [Desulfoscipio gibsoniae DSM 7213]